METNLLKSDLLPTKTQYFKYKLIFFNSLLFPFIHNRVRQSSSINFNYMKLKQVFSLLFVLTFFCKTYGQTINTDTLKSYPSSVIARVFGVAKYVSLNNSEQITLANLFVEEEQQTAGLIISGATVASVDSMKSAFKYLFNNAIDSNKINNYYSALAQSNAIPRVQVSNQLLNNKYSQDSILNSNLFNINKWRETQIQKVMLQFSDSAVRDQNLFAVSTSYDSLYDSYLNLAKASNFLHQNLQLLDSVNAVSSGYRTAITSLYNNLCIANPNRSYADNFKTAFYTVFTNLSDTVYYNAIFSSDIAKAASTNAAKAIYSYAQNQFISSTDIQSLSTIVMNRENSIAAINMMYTASNGYRDSLVQMVMDSYQPSIGAILDRGAQMDKVSMIPLALKMKDVLGITGSQFTNLKQAADQLSGDYINYITNLGISVLPSYYDCNALKGLLTWNQYQTLLEARYSYEAVQKTMDDISYLNGGWYADWQQTNRSISELYNFHLQMLTSYYYNADNPYTQFGVIQNLLNNLPELYAEVLEDKYSNAIYNSSQFGTYYGSSIETNLLGNFYQW